MLYSGSSMTGVKVETGVDGDGSMTGVEWWWYHDGF